MGEGSEDILNMSSITEDHKKHYNIYLEVEKFDAHALQSLPTSAGFLSSGSVGKLVSHFHASCRPGKLLGRFKLW